jgi:hypothetical protein
MKELKRVSMQELLLQFGTESSAYSLLTMNIQVKIYETIILPFFIWQCFSADGRVTAGGMWRVV